MTKWRNKYTSFSLRVNAAKSVEICCDSERSSGNMMDVGHQEVAATCLHLRKCANLNCWEEQAELISCTHVEGGSLGFCKTCSHSEHVYVLKETTTILHHVSEVGGAWTDGERCSMRRRTRSSILLLWITPDTDHPPTHPVGEARTPFFFFWLLPWVKTLTTSFSACIWVLSSCTSCTKWSTLEEKCDGPCCAVKVTMKDAWSPSPSLGLTLSAAVIATQWTGQQRQG